MKTKEPVNLFTPRCKRCGRPLTGKKSVERGMGHRCHLRTLQPEIPGLEKR